MKKLLTLIISLIIVQSSLAAFPFDKTNYQKYKLHAGNNVEIMSEFVNFEKSYYDGIETWRAYDENFNAVIIVRFKEPTRTMPEFGFSFNGEEKWYFESNIDYNVSRDGNHRYIFYFDESDSYFKFLIHSEGKVSLGGWAFQK